MTSDKAGYVDYHIGVALLSPHSNCSIPRRFHNVDLCRVTQMSMLFEDMDGAKSDYVISNCI